MIYHNLTRSIYSASSLFFYRNLDLIVKDTDIIFPFRFVKTKCDIPVGILPTTVFNHDDIGCLNYGVCLISSIRDNTKPFYRLEILYVGGTGSNQNNVIGVGNYELIDSSDKGYSSSFGSDYFTCGYVSEGGVRCNGKATNSVKGFKWEDGDTLSLEINVRDKEVAFLRGHKLHPYIIKKIYPDNLISGVFSKSHGVLFHILFFGPVDNLEYLEILKIQGKRNYQYI